MSQASQTDDSRSIAIIGMSGRFPGAPTVAQFWQNLVAGATSIRCFSDEELLAAGVPPSLIQQPNYVKSGTLIDQVDRFDAEFFGYSAREAELMDPQHRLFLECCWEALEDGGCDPESFRNPIGVFAGSGFPTYLTYNVASHPDLVAAAGELQLAVGNERDSLASTVSYKLNLRGPSVAVQTFCSTSLVAVHLACQSLLTYECGLALAGGVAIPIPQGVGYLYEEGGIVSPDGCCRSFDANGQGSVMGSGLGVVALKRLKNALADGDQIYAVIKGSAVNNDGSAKVGYTAPGTSGQATVIALALRRANVPPETISYIETHGTGTPLGDSIELAAMLKAFGRQTQRQQFCAIGSVKPNIGHLDRASGVTGLIKASMALRHGQIPASLNFEQPNPEIDLAHSPFFVNTELRPWPSGGAPRRAGVSSFGLGGTNAHVVLEEAPARPAPTPARPEHLLLLSAKTPAALEAMSANLAAHLRAHPEQALADVAYTLQAGRASFNHRRALVCAGPAEAIAALEAPGGTPVQTRHTTYRDRPVMLIFPEGPAFAPGATRELYRGEPVFREALDRCAAVLTRLLGRDPLTALYPAAGQTDAAPPEQADALAAAVSYALAQWLLQAGVQPRGLLGSGSGEYTAACVAGIIPLEQALELVVLRRRALDSGDPAALLDRARRLTLKPPQIPLVAQRTGVWLTAEQAGDPGFWTHYDWSAARFREGLATLCQEDGNLLLEVGPAPHQSGLEPDIRSLLPAESGGRSESARLLASLAELWLDGARIGWPAFGAAERRQRVSLPTYPFERRRYWVERQELPAQTGAAPADPGKRADIADWFYLPGWRQTLAAAPGEQTPPRPGHWLILADGEGLAERLAERLRAQQSTVTLARIGAAFEQLGEHEYALDPSRPADYRQLLRALPQAPGGVLHLWSLGPPAGALLDTERFDQAQRRGFESLVHLVRALGRQIATTTPELWVVTQQSWRVTGGEELSPEHATLAGACMVVAQENLDMRCYQLDIDRPAPGSWQERRLLDQLLAELAAPSAALAVAYRAGERWTRAYEPARLPAPARPALRQGGVYVITGGLGNVGLVLAEHLARAWQAKLVLTSHGPFPPEERWDAWLAEHDGANPVSQRIRALQSCRAAGGEVLVVSADVADPAQLRTALDAAQERFGAPHGLIYAAGTGADRSFGTVQEIDLEGGKLHFVTKAHGLIALEQVLADRPLDFCVVFSSLASVLGGLGFVAYTAANSFVDAFVQRHNQISPARWTAVNWDTWNIKENPHGDLGATVLDFAMSRAEALEAFERIAAAPAAGQLVNSTGDLEARLDQWVRMVAFRARGSQPAELHPRPNLLTPYEPPSNETEEIITDIWQQVLGIEVGVQDHFLELGGNSLIGTQVVTRLRRSFQCNIPLTILFDAPTIAEMATAVELILIDEITQLDQDALLRLTEA